MRRICTTLVLVSSLLVAAGPAQAKSSAIHRQQARTAAVQKHHVTTNRAGIAGTRVQKFTYGRT